MADITREQAVATARETIASMPTDNELALFEDKTLDTPFGWVFFYNSRTFVETGDKKHFVRGAAPLIVDRRDGSTHFTGTARPVDYYIEEYQKAHP